MNDFHCKLSACPIRPGRPLFCEAACQEMKAVVVEIRRMAVLSNVEPPSRGNNNRV